jgi:hypothetical protein
MWSDDEHAWTSDTEDDVAADTGPAIIMDPEVWMDAWSEELLNVWDAVRDAAATQGVLDACSFPDFAQFCFQHSSGHPPPGFS